MDVLLETKRLRIRPFDLADAPCLYENHLDEEVKKWFPNESYRDLRETQEAIQFCRDCVQQKHLPYVLAAELKTTGELIGNVGTNEVEGKPGEVEIGYIIFSAYRKQGYATELLEAMTAYIGKVFGSSVLYGRVIHGNQASVRVLEKNGYTFVAEEFGAEDDPYGKGMLIYKKTC